MERVKRYALAGAVTAVGVLSFGAAPASAAPNENACTGQAVSGTAQFGKENNLPYRGVAGAFLGSPQQIGPTLRAFNEACH